MGKPPLVSVVIPAYNNGDTISRAIRSALNQTYENIEVIVVNDASTDNTEEKILNFDDNRIEYICHQDNQGGAAARNTGITHATGEYIAFLDADDRWFSQKIERQVVELEDRSNQWIAAYCGVKDTPRETLLRKLAYSVLTDIRYGNEGGKSMIPKVLSQKFYLGGTSVIIAEREAIEAIDGFDERFDSLQDMEFLIRLLERGKLAYVDEDLIEKNFTGYGTNAESVAKIKELYLNKFAEKVISMELNHQQVIAVHRFDIAKFHFMEGDFDEGLKALKKSRAAMPVDYIGLLKAILSGITD